MGNKRKAHATETLEQRKTREEDISHKAHKAREDNYRRAIVSMQNEVQSKTKGKLKRESDAEAMGNKRKARVTETPEQRKVREEDILHNAREDSYRKAIVSVQKEVKSYTRGKKNLHKFLANRFSTLRPPRKKTHEKILTILTNLKEQEPGLLQKIEEPDDSTCVSVKEMSREELKKKIKRVFKEMYGCLTKGGEYNFEFWTRKKEYQIFDDKTERMVLKKGPYTTRTLKMGLQEGPYTKRSLNILTKALSMKYALDEVYMYCKTGTCFSKRDFYYSHEGHFIKQTHSDKILEDVCLYLECTMASIGVSPCNRGEVLGDLQLFYDNKEEVSFKEFKEHGHSIPHSINRVASIASSTALFVFLVEKDTVFLKLAENKFHEKYRCILVTAKGYGDIATRLLLRRIQKDLHLPMIGLTDFDPHGLEILSVYRYGSKNLSFDCRSLVIPNIRWIGILSGDKEAFNNPDRCSMDMSEASIAKGENMAKSGYMEKNKLWRKELDKMNASKKTLEIEALKSIHNDHLVHRFLPMKLESEGWLL